MAAFVIPFWLSIFACAIGTALVSRKYSSQGLVFYSVMYFASLFGVTLAGRLIMDIATYPLSALFTFLLGLCLPFLIMKKLHSART